MTKKDESNIKAIVNTTMEGIKRMPKWQQHLNKIQLAEKAVEEISVTDEQTMTDALETQKQIKNSAKEIDGLRDFIVRPHNDAVKAANGVFKPAVDKLKSLALTIDKKVMAFRAEQNRKAAEAAAEIEKDRLAKEAELKAKGKMEETQTLSVPMAVEAAAPQAIQKTVAVGNSKATFIKYWQFAITDPDLVPKEYLMPNVVAIGKAVRNDKVRDIPGVRIWSEERAR